ncbi:MAG: GyrI-like domain-containing protein [Chitinophagaceae bacterium]|nr:GyrI-like domain-containing protein [Chitinophagaceae bacterium]
MNIEIITKPLTLEVYGFAGRASNGNYAQTAFGLMDRMWQIVKSKGLPNKGLNIWIYEPDEMVFAGVELTAAQNDTGMEHKKLELSKYAYYKHIGPYHLIKQAVQQMQAELKARGLAMTLPYVEIYGHHTPDETQAETELLMQLT